MKQIIKKKTLYGMVIQLCKSSHDIFEKIPYLKAKFKAYE